jgi:hypothetical protein
MCVTENYELDVPQRIFGRYWRYLVRWKCGVTTAVGTIVYTAVPVRVPLEMNSKVYTQVRNFTYCRCVQLYTET